MQSDETVRAAQQALQGQLRALFVATMTGALIQKTDRQPRAESSAPPTAGPASMLSPNTDAQTPIARARSRGSGIAFTTIASVSTSCSPARARCRRARMAMTPPGRP